MMTVLNVISYCAAAVAVIAIPYLLIDCARFNKARKVRPLVTPRFPKKAISLFLVSTLTVVIVSTAMSTYARYDVLKFVNSLSGNYKVYVNQQEVPEPDKMVSALKELAPYWAHHSHPTKRIRLLIRTDVRDLTLELGRDSDNPQEYWIFYPEHDLTSNNEIGRITTSAFNEY